MMTTRFVSVLLPAFWLLLLAAGCRGDAGPEKPDLLPVPERKQWTRAAKALEPLHRTKRPPAPSDWLAQHEEKGQTFEAYVASDPVRPDEKRDTLYILLLGRFSPARKKVVTLTAEFMSIYFGLPVSFADPVPLAEIPARARRVHPSWGVKQINASYILEEVLEPRVPDDAVALIAFTASDLWPGPGWNFVFGLASLWKRVGVWSIHRNGDPAESEEAFALCLLRTLKTGTHETGHMLGMRHCIAYECNMNGSNHRAEADSQPLALCPECVRKIWWACGVDPLARYRKLEAFCRRHGLEKEADFYAASAGKIAFLDEKKDE